METDGRGTIVINDGSEGSKLDASTIYSGVSQRFVKNDHDY